jgi:hypothetical protein
MIGDTTRPAVTAAVARGLEFALLAIPIALCAFAVARIAASFDRGFDLTDEGFYLMWARSPEDIVGVRNFGHYTGLLFAVSGYSVAGFRWLGLGGLLVFAAVFATAYQRAERIAISSGEATRTARGAGFATAARWSNAAGFATVVIAALGYYAHFWVPSPSYNWLLLIAQLLGYSGLLFWSFPRERFRAIAPNLGGAAFGIAIALAFMSKPPAAIALVFVGAAWIVLGSGLAGFGRWFGDAAPAPRGRKRFVIAAIAGGATIAIVHAIFFDSPVAWFLQLRDGYDLIMVLGGQQSGLVLSTLRTILGFPLSAIAWAPLWWTAGLLLIAACVRFVPSAEGSETHGPRSGTRSFALQLVFAGAIFALAGSLGRAGAWQGGFDREGLGIGQPVAVLALGTTAMLMIRRYLAPDDTGTSIRTSIQLALFLATGALVYGFASTNGILIQTGGAVVFFATAGMSTARRLGAIPAAAFNAVVAIGLVLQLHDSLAQPYRLAASIDDQVEPVTIAVPATQLRFDPTTARYFEALTHAAATGGFEPGTALIDLTGGSPGALFAIGARGPVSPWMPGSYFGSQAFARSSLAQIPEAVRTSAWVLTTPDGPRRLPDDLLREVGLDFPAHYTRIAEFRSPTRKELQVLWRPDERRAERGAWPAKRDSPR